MVDQPLITIDLLERGENCTMFVFYKFGDRGAGKRSCYVYIRQRRADRPCHRKKI
jgi:hypothetical protein